MSKDRTDTLYTPFDDGDAERYKLKPTSKEHVAAVCLVQANRISLNHQARASYADQAGLQAARYETITKDADTRKLPVFELDDIWNEYYVHAALAQALFYGFPELVQAKFNEKKDLFEIELLNVELFNKLNEGVVNEAFLAFSRQRNATLNALLSGLNASTNAPNTGRI